MMHGPHPGNRWGQLPRRGEPHPNLHQPSAARTIRLVQGNSSGQRNECEQRQAKPCFALLAQKLYPRLQLRPGAVTQQAHVHEKRNGACSAKIKMLQHQGAQQRPWRPQASRRRAQAVFVCQKGGRAQMEGAPLTWHTAWCRLSARSCGTAHSHPCLLFLSPASPTQPIQLCITYNDG